VEYGNAQCLTVLYNIGAIAAIASQHRVLQRAGARGATPRSTGKGKVGHLATPGKIELLPQLCKLAAKHGHANILRTLVKLAEAGDHARMLRPL
jgi:hypothetical protein